MAAKSDIFVRCFDVSDPRKHPKGHTIYKVTFKKFSKKTTDLVEEIVIWKRYNDFKKLHKILSEWHRKLQKHDDFPPFARATVFGRFEDAVIEERRHCAFELMAFAGSHHHLYSHPAFMKFFEGGERLDPNRDLKKVVTLQPQKLHLPKGSSADTLTTTDTASTSASDDLPQIENKDDDLGGVWQYRQAMDNISLNSNEIVESEEDTDFTDESSLSTPLPENDLTFFDPLGEAPAADLSGQKLSNMWLLSAMSVCAELDDKSAEPSPQHQPMAPKVLGSKELMAKELEEMLAISSDPSEGSGDLPSGLTFPPIPGDPPDAKSKQFQTDRGAPLTQKTKPKNALSRTIEAIANRSRSASSDSVSTMEIGGKEDYIFQAANQICTAQECEANGNYELAFGYYKNGVGILLQGVQGDGNKARREAVRKKTAQYLLKAEDLYNRHLKPEITDEQRWAKNSKLSPASELDPGVAFLQGPMSELRNYRVLGIVDEVMLVLDKSSENTYVMKVHTLSKSESSQHNKNIIPHNIPYMVRLYRFYETECSIYLLLQHASGGKLWNYISAYLNQHYGDDKAINIGCDQDGTETRNVYMGQKVLTTESSLIVVPGPGKPERTSVNLDETGDSGTLETECSTSYAELMKVYRSESVIEALGQDPYVKSEASETEHTTSSVTTFSESKTDNTTNTSLHEKNVEYSPETGELEENNKTNHPHLQSFSSLDDVSFSSDAPGLTPVTPPVGSNVFSDILNGAANKTGMENFSIASMDSDRRHSSTSCENVDSPEITDKRSPVVPKDSNRQTDPTSPIRRYSLEGFLDDIPEHDDICDNIIELDSRGKEVQRRRSCDIRLVTDGATTEHDDGLPSTKELVSNARELLRSVDATLKGKNEVEVVAGDPDEEARKRISSFDDVFADEKCEWEKSKDSHLLDSGLNEGDESACNLSVVSAGMDQLSQTSSEPCIYDLNKPLYTDSDSLLSADSSKFNIPMTEEWDPVSSQISSDKEYNKVISVLSTDFLEESGSTVIASSPSDTHSRAGSVLRGQEALIVKPSKPSRLERSFSNESAGSERRFSLSSLSKPRKRHFSSIFSQLDQMCSGTAVKLPETCVVQWGAEIVCAITKLHSIGIICRDLRPDNILLGERGHILLTYFSSWIEVHKDLHEDALSDLYCAPELWVGTEPVTAACDWWSFGAILFELLTCRALYTCHPSGINSHTQLNVPDHVSPEGQSILTELLRYNASERLGSGISGSDDVKMHPFFQRIDWASIYATGM